MKFLGVLALDSIITIDEFSDIVSNLIKSQLTTLEIKRDPHAANINPKYMGWHIHILEKLTNLDKPNLLIGFNFSTESFGDEKDKTLEFFSWRVIQLLTEGKLVFIIPAQRPIKWPWNLLVLEAKKCPKCGSALRGIYFMGDKTRPPEFIDCEKCGIAYDPATMKPMANVIS